MSDLKLLARETGAALRAIGAALLTFGNVSEEATNTPAPAIKPAKTRKTKVADPEPEETLDDPEESLDDPSESLDDPEESLDEPAPAPAKTAAKPTLADVRKVLLALQAKDGGKNERVHKIMRLAIPEGALVTGSIPENMFAKVIKKANELIGK